MPVSDEYASRTACRDHTIINTQPLRGSLRGQFYSQCEKARFNYTCKYSHTVFNINRVHKIVSTLWLLFLAQCGFSTSQGNRDGRKSYVVCLDYGHGFERYGCYEGWDSGWEVRDEFGYPPRSSQHGIGQARVHDLPKALLVKEARTGLKVAGDPLVRLL